MSILKTGFDRKEGVLLLEQDLSAHVAHEKSKILKAKGRRSSPQPLWEGRPQPGEVSLTELEHSQLEKERPPYA